MLQFLFSGACLWRWNDKLRPVELSEIEKQAHKMLVAAVLLHESAKALEAEKRVELESRVIEGSLFDYFYRLVITDIKPPVFYRIRQNPSQYHELTKYVLDRLEPRLAPLGAFWNRMKAWHTAQTGVDESARKILAASHLYASQWEFKLIEPLNHFDEEMPSIAKSFQDELNALTDLPALNAILDRDNALGKFANLCGQLRFQIRWTQAPRLPATSVLGHMFIVAAMAYLFSLAIGASQARACNNFFGGLFHDFPEVLTRDIISPVKVSVSGLSAIIKEYEESELERRVLLPLRKNGYASLVRRLEWYLGLPLGSEFQNACKIDGQIKIIDSFAEMKKHDLNRNDPRDGLLLKKCDLLAAYLEAHTSIRNGVTSRQLVSALPRLQHSLLDNAPEELNLEALLADFD